MFKKWQLVLLLVMSAQVQAYQQGDLLTERAKAQLNLNPDRVTIIDFFAEFNGFALINFGMLVLLTSCSKSKNFFNLKLFFKLFLLICVKAINKN